MFCDDINQASVFQSHSFAHSPSFSAETALFGTCILATFARLSAPFAVAGFDLTCDRYRLIRREDLPRSLPNTRLEIACLCSHYSWFVNA